MQRTRPLDDLVLDLVRALQPDASAASVTIEAVADVRRVVLTELPADRSPGRCVTLTSPEAFARVLADVALAPLAPSPGAPPEVPLGRVPEELAPRAEAVLETWRRERSDARVHVETSGERVTRVRLASNETLWIGLSSRRVLARRVSRYPGWQSLIAAGVACIVWLTVGTRLPLTDLAVVAALLLAATLAARSVHRWLR